MAQTPRVILLIETSRTYPRGLLRGIGKYSHIQGSWSFYREPPPYLSTWGRKKTLSWLRNCKADGIIMRESELTEEIIALGLPTILSPYINPTGEIPGPPNIIGDDAKIGRMAAEHLLDRGFSHFAYCGLGDIFWSRIRGESFSEKIAEAGFETHFYKQDKSKKNVAWEKELSFMAEWLKTLPKPLGLMTCTDERSQHIIEACRIAGFRVPEDIAVIGVDDDQLVCELSDPPLSSVFQDSEKAGYEAAQLLEELMAGRKSAKKEIIVDAPYIVKRQSTDILAIEDREVVEAVRYIREHSKENIGVDNVVEATALSRRVLERRFSRILGRSIYSEIRRTRVEQAVRMLLQTNMSISQIASALGYPSVDHIARYFKREKGMSLVAYRRRFGGG